MPYAHDDPSLLAQLAESQQYADLITIMASATRLPREIVLGMGSRESGWGLYNTPPGPAGTGDYGHGRGLMQIDDRAHPEFCATDDWKDPAKNLAYAARVHNEGHSSLAAHTALYGDQLTRGAIAAYNCGAGNVKRALDAGLSVERYTAHGDYVTDIYARAAWFAAHNGSQ